jgi:hypothetical protein
MVIVTEVRQTNQSALASLIKKSYLLVTCMDARLRTRARERIRKPRQMTDNGGAMLLVISKCVRGENCEIVTPIEFEGQFGLGRDGRDG